MLTLMVVGSARQLAVGRLIDHQAAGAVDLDAQAAALRRIFRHIEPRLALGIGHIARFGDEHGAVEITKRNAHRGHGLRGLGMRIRDHNGYSSLSRSLLRNGSALRHAQAQQ